MTHQRRYRLLSGGTTQVLVPVERAPASPLEWHTLCPGGSQRVRRRRRILVRIGLYVARGFSEPIIVVKHLLSTGASTRAGIIGNRTRPRVCPFESAERLEKRVNRVVPPRRDVAIVDGRVAVRHDDGHGRTLALGSRSAFRSNGVQCPRPDSHGRGLVEPVTPAQCGLDVAITPQPRAPRRPKAVRNTCTAGRLAEPD